MKHLLKEAMQPEVSVESIDIRANAKMVKELKKEINKLRKFNKVEKKDVSKSKIDKIIKNNTGLTFVIDTENIENAFVELPEVSNNNPIAGFMTRLFVGDEEASKYVKKEGEFSFTLDMTRGFITGHPQKIKHKMMIGSPLLSKSSRLTVDETVAIIMHEIGHILTYYYALQFMNVSSWLIDDFSVRLLEVKNPTLRLKFIEEVEENENITLNGKENISKAKTLEEIQTVMLEDIIDDFRQDYGKGTYNNRMMEALADQYCASQGLALPLATALDKISYKDLSFTGQVIVSMFKASLYSAFLVGPATIFSAAFLAALISIVAHMLTGESISTYDSFYRRIRLLKRQLILELKETSNDNSQIKKILEDIDKIEDIIKDRKDILDFCFNAIANPFARKEKRIIALQRLLEDLSASDLNISAAKINQLIN